MTNETQEKIGEILIFRSEVGEPEIQVRFEEESVWLSQRLMSDLFQKDTDTIGLHLKNIYTEGELEEKSTTEFFSVVQKEGKRKVTRRVKYYNLDAIISVGYRVNSKRGTQFRIWATNVLREHLVKGYTINEKRLKESNERLKELGGAVRLIENAKSAGALSAQETAGLLTIITEYARSWLLLHEYDKGILTPKELHLEVRFRITEEEAVKAIDGLRKSLIDKHEAGELFGKERERGILKGILASIDQNFGGVELYSSIEQKAANLLYFLIKDHPFSDGNKRIASLLFIWFLRRNGLLPTPEGKRKINDNALVALALLVAQSNPKDKETMTKLVTSLLSLP